ncbi:MAG: glycosyltransferase [Bacteroidota bacterium]
MTSAEILMMIILFVTAGTYTLLIMLFTAGWSKLKMNHRTEAAVTRMSVIIPLRNESNNIRRLLEMLLSQNYPEDLYELILVNDHSGDDTAEQLHKHPDSDKITFLELPDGSSGKKSALMFGIAHAKGKLIVTTDADCRAGDEWLKAIEAYYCMGNFRMIAGPVAIENPSGWLAKFQSLEFISLQGSGAGAIGIGLPIMNNGANLAFEKYAFEEVKGYSGNEHIPGGDDIFLLEKFKKEYGPQSIGFVKNRTAIVYTDASKNLNSFLNQRFRWVAKSPAYRDPAIIFTAFIVFLLNLELLICLFWAPLSYNIFIVAGAIFLFKCVSDLPLLWKATGFFRQRHLLRNYLPFQLSYFSFIVISVVLGNLFSYKWKERNSRIN